MNYIKQNHLSLLIILFLVVSAFLSNTPTANLFSSINRPSTTVTNPVVFQQGVSISANADNTTNALTVIGTTTIKKSYDGFTIHKDVTVATTSRSVYGNDTGIDMICGAGVLYWNSTGFSPSLVVSMGTTTVSTTHTVTMLASTTVATTTDTFLLLYATPFLLPTGSSISLAMYDITNANASSTYYGNWDVEYDIPCTLIGVE